MIKKLLCSVALLTSAPIGAQTALTAEEAATRFGARENVLDIALSPDGKTVAYVTPRTGQGSAVYAVDLTTGTPKLVTAADGNPLKINWCNWVSNQRMVCSLYSIQAWGGDNYAASRLIAVNADGSGLKMVSQVPGSNARGMTFNGGGIIDWLPAEENAVLMATNYVPEGKVGSLIESRDKGLGVDRIDTVTLKKSPVHSAEREAAQYMTDGRGNIRIMGLQAKVGDGYAEDKVKFSYRRKDSKAWTPFATYNVLDDSGFRPVAVDPDKDIVYGLKKKDGRLALFSVSLDGNLTEQLVYAHPKVDVDGVVQIGRQRRVIGVSFSTDVTETVFLDKDVEAMSKALAKALPGRGSVDVIDASFDGNILMLRVGRDNNPGEYYVFDRVGKRLNKIMLSRPQLDGMKLAEMRPVTFKASDGAMVPGYLTLPPGKESAKGLPAIVMPHGGPEARDYWGFDWLSQYYANRGYAVLQPNFRGSTGYGDAWFQQNGFQSWRSAVGDVVDAGRWLVSEGIADPSKLAIVGWSYGGYAALQSGVVAPDLYKAIVAIAPVTDFRMTIDENRDYTNYRIEKERIGSGPHIKEGSPAQNVAAFKAPVLLFHGDMDLNVGVKQSQFMADQLRGAGKKEELVVFPGLAHSLDDSAARSRVLRESDQFLRTSMGM